MKKQTNKKNLKKREKLILKLELTVPIFAFVKTRGPYRIGKKILNRQTKKKNTVVSGNAGDEKNLHPGGHKFNFFNQFN